MNRFHYLAPLLPFLFVACGGSKDSPVGTTPPVTAGVGGSGGGGSAGASGSSGGAGGSAPGGAAGKAGVGGIGNEDLPMCTKLTLSGPAQCGSGCYNKTHTCQKDPLYGDTVCCAPYCRRGAVNDMQAIPPQDTPPDFPPTGCYPAKDCAPGGINTKDEVFLPQCP